jgi:uncharacterized repeat protein (TIGR01451 family)
VSSAAVESITTNNSSSVTSTVNNAADLGVTKSGPVTAQPGTTVEYTITVTNIGPQIAHNTTITEFLPAGVTPVNTTGFLCVFGTPGDVSRPTVCTVGDISAGTSAVGTFTVLIGENLTAGTSLTNSFTASSETTDPFNGNNTIAFETVIALGIADLSIVKTDTPDPVVAGTNLTYSITVTNGGPAPAPATIVRDFLPADVSFVGITSTPAVPCVPGVPGNPAAPTTCNLGTLASGAVVTITLTVQGTQPCRMARCCPIPRP